MTDYTVITKFRNKEQCDILVGKIRFKGKTCYNFCDTPADSDAPDSSAEEQMQAFESVEDFQNDEHFKKVFKKDLDGLKNANKVVMLLPAGNSVHIEAGIAYGLGKPLILIGKPEKPDSLYLIFKERYDTIDDFVSSIK